MPKRFVTKDFWDRWFQHLARGAYLAIVILAALSLGILGGWVRYEQVQLKKESERTDNRFCIVTAAFINSNIALRSVQNEIAFEGIGARRDFNNNATQLLNDFKKAPASPIKVALLGYLESEIAINTAINTNAIRTINEADKVAAQWATLKKELRCAS